MVIAEVIRAAMEAMKSDECLLWPQPSGTSRYANVRGPSRMMGGDRVQARIGVHALACSLLHGQRPVGAQAAHLCHTALCYNPRHLVWASPLENMAMSATAHCQNGHEFSPDNTYVDTRGRRNCRICKNDRWRRSYYRRRWDEGYRRNPQIP